MIRSMIVFAAMLVPETIMPTASPVRELTAVHVCVDVPVAVNVVVALKQCSPENISDLNDVHIAVVMPAIV